MSLLFRRGFSATVRNARRREFIPGREYEYFDVEQDMKGFIEAVKKSKNFPKPQPGCKEWGGEGHRVMLSIVKNGKETVIGPPESYPSWVLGDLFNQPTLYDMMKKYYTQRHIMSQDEIKKYRKKLRKMRIKQENNKDADIGDE